MKQSDTLAWLMNWYASNCDGEWEHGYGVTISTIDNPGWSLLVELDGTDMDGVAFATVEHNLVDEQNWWRCWVKDNKFEGAGGPHELATMIEVFRAWVTTASPFLDLPTPSA